MYNDYIKLKALRIDAYIGLGGNIGDVQLAIESAVERLRDEPNTQVGALSPLYRTAAVGGPPGQPDYLNAVARIETILPPGELLQCCLDIEARYGRVRLERYGPRSIDLDILLYGDEVLDAPGLIVPHPRLRERLFALAPLTDVAPLCLRLPPDGKELVDVVDEAAGLHGLTLKQFKEYSVIS